MTADAVLVDALIDEVTGAPTAVEVRRTLAARWPETPDRIGEISRYAVLAPGKLLRPLLLVAAAEAVGGSRAQVLPAAHAVEDLHVASLIHDDIIDGDGVRRGRPSVHARYGVPDAIVTGDALMLGMFAAVADCAAAGVPAPAVLAAVQVLATAGVDLCRGQVQEALLAAHGTVAEYLEVAALKTGALFRGACRAGAILGGGSAAQVEALTGYAEHTGLAFQMHDDLLPYLADQAVTGKPGTSDAANRRPTFPVLVAYELGDAGVRRRIDATLAGDLPPDATLAALRAAVLATGALDEARRRARRESALARAALGPIAPSPARTLLGSVAELAVARDR